VCTPKARRFLGALHAQFDARRRQLLEERAELQARIDSGLVIDYAHETSDIRKSRSGVHDGHRARVCR
jgi:malate synthase